MKLHPFGRDKLITEEALRNVHEQMKQMLPLKRVEVPDFDSSVPYEQDVQCLPYDLSVPSDPTLLTVLSVPSEQAGQGVLSVPYEQAELYDQYGQAVPSNNTVKPIVAKEKYGAGYLHPGVSVATVDESFFPSPDAKEVLNAEHTLEPRGNMVVPVYGDAGCTYVDSIEVTVDGVQIPKSMYYIEPLAMGLHFTNLAITGSSTVRLNAHFDYSPKEILNRVLILPASKDIPFNKLHEFTPNLFEAISIDHLLKYPDNKRHAKKLITAQGKPFSLNQVHVLSYTIEKRGIYASVKYYTD